MENIIIEDKREIQAIRIFAQDARDEISYSSSNICKIQAYHENGDMAPIVWFNVIRNNVVVAKINSRYVYAVEY